MNVVITSLPGRGVLIDTNDLSTMFAETKRIFIARDEVAKLSVVGIGESERVRIRYHNGDADELTASVVDSFDGQGVVNNNDLFDRFLAIL